jgi:hypothetical protein
MKMKIFSLMLILVLSMSMVSSASAYGHGDIRAGYIGYLSDRVGVDILSDRDCVQSIFLANQLLYPKGYGLKINVTDNRAREYVDITKEQKDSNGSIIWNPEFNKDHLLNFPAVIFYDVDYSKGVFIAHTVYPDGAYYQSTVVYYYSSNNGSEVSKRVFDYIIMLGKL